MAYEILIYEYVNFETFEFKKNFEKVQSILLKDGVTITDIRPKDIDFDKQQPILISVETNNTFFNCNEDEIAIQGYIEVECINQITKNSDGKRIPELTYTANNNSECSRKVLNADILSKDQFAFIADHYRQTTRTWSGLDFNYSIQFTLGYLALTPNAFATYLIPGQALLYQDIKAIHDYIIAHDIQLRNYDELYTVWNALKIEAQVLTLKDYQNMDDFELNKILNG